MKKVSIQIGVVFLFAVLFWSCQGPQSRGGQTFNAPQEDTLTYASEDGTLLFALLSRSDEGDGSIRIQELNSGIFYDLMRVRSASGEKYEDDDGNFFWLKGDDFLWGNGEQTLATGSLLVEGEAAFTTPALSDSHFGIYVTEGYTRRFEGFDWVSVTISPLAGSRVRLSVRSRADKKKPTCTFDDHAQVIGANTLESFINGQRVVFDFAGEGLIISAKSAKDESALYYPCSGGGSLAGSYIRIDESLDEKQRDKRTYVKTLAMNEQFFDIEVEQDQLSILPRGLAADNRPVQHAIDGSVVRAEIGDLNIDGQAEVLVYVTLAGSGSYGSVIGYSVNDGKSMSQIYLPDLANNAEASEGYMGHDEFAIVESTLVRRFPIYRDGDSNANPSGGTRQIQYKLVNGEASRKFEIDTVIEY